MQQIGYVKELLARHQVLSRLMWLGIGPTAVLVVIELSAYFSEHAG